MEQNIKAFSHRVCDYSIGSKNRKITGLFHMGGFKYKPFEFNGENARELIRILIEHEDTD